MENMSPTLSICIYLVSSLENGRSVRMGLRDWVTLSEGEMAQNLTRSIIKFEQKGVWESPIPASYQQEVLFDLIGRGLKGESILLSLKSLRLEILKASRLEIESHLKSLPFKLMIPLLGLHFPAFLILLFSMLLGDFY